MTFDVVTIFPELVEQIVSAGVVGRGRAAGRLHIAVHDLRDFTDDRHRTVDDAPYGGGPGMVLKPAPFVRALDRIRTERGDPDTVILLSPQGATLTHEMVMRFSRLNHIVLLCGRYEGVDERVRTQVATEEISIGDYVLSGGELPAGVVIEAVARQVPGVVGNTESVAAESFVRRLLDHPHYTRPASLDEAASGDAGAAATTNGSGTGDVPDVLVSGNHADIRRWRKREAVRRTLERRPDLLAAAGPDLDEEEQEFLRELQSASRRQPRTAQTGAGR